MVCILLAGPSIFSSSQVPGFKLLVLLISLCGNPVAAQTIIMTDDPVYSQQGAGSVSADFVDQLISEGIVLANEVSNPHWQEDGCIICHAKKPAGKSSELHLRSNDALNLCYNCHDKNNEHTSVHPAWIIPSDKVLSNISNDFKNTLSLDEGNINCLTCHDVKVQCKLSSVYRQQHFPAFIRGFPYGSRTEFCFNCHVNDGYKPLVSHQQINAQGELIENKCLLCHLEVPEQSESGASQKTELIIEQDWKSICANCHTEVPHPSSNAVFARGKIPNHLVVPPEEILIRMKLMSELNNVNLPIDESTGKLFCGTCHNPHEEGVIKNPSGAKGAGHEKRLRANPICNYCHDN